MSYRAFDRALLCFASFCRMFYRAFDRALLCFATSSLIVELDFGEYLKRDPRIDVRH